MKKKDCSYYFVLRFVLSSQRVMMRNWQRLLMEGGIHLLK
jgi:hypothetical protein